MDKKTFIRELRQALSVLQEDELNDIVSEYEQHIDMKMKNGLTEDDAIADFGSLTELTADILEAYHVRSDYAGETGKEKKTFSEKESRKAGRLLRQTGGGLKAAGGIAADALRRIGRRIWGIVPFWKKQAGRFRIFPGGTGKALLAEKRKQDRFSLPKLIGSSRQTGIACIRLVLRLVLWGLRAVWNICCAGTFLMCAGIGILFLYMLGMTTVLRMQHYPLTGVTVGCLGLVLCAFSAAGFCLTLFWKKKDSRFLDGDGQDKAEESPVPYQEMKGGQHA